MTFLHETPDFSDLIAIVGQDLSIDPALIEKDYWIMHCLFGLQQLNLSFELKGGTSLSKGFHIIHRFSEDIDIQINPSEELPTGRNHTKPAHIAARRAYFNDLADTIAIPGVTSVVRDETFDDDRMRSAGIRLIYTSHNDIPAGVKNGVLLEAGFDQVAPNSPCDFSSWTYDRAIESGLTDIVDNRAIGVACYSPEYTLVEKLHAISRKFRKQQDDDSMPRNFMRHYYDVYCLLTHDPIIAFIGTDAYKAHKAAKFTQNDEHDIGKNEAFLLSDDNTRTLYQNAYESTRALYYQDMPSFDAILERIAGYAKRL
jgi:nucleotidyltransferase AbiEii toxin of type IV toxin-antitoxin system